MSMLLSPNPRSPCLTRTYAARKTAVAVEGLSNPIISFGSTTKSAQATVKSRAAGLRLVVEKGASQTINDDCI